MYNVLYHTTLTGMGGEGGTSYKQKWIVQSWDSAIMVWVVSTQFTRLISIRTTSSQINIYAG